jgi:hypothetical protein
MLARDLNVFRKICLDRPDDETYPSFEVRVLPSPRRRPLTVHLPPQRDTPESPVPDLADQLQKRKPLSLEAASHTGKNTQLAQALAVGVRLGPPPVLGHVSRFSNPVLSVQPYFLVRGSFDRKYDPNCEILDYR